MSLHPRMVLAVMAFAVVMTSCSTVPPPSGPSATGSHPDPQQTSDSSSPTLNGSALAKDCPDMTDELSAALNTRIEIGDPRDYVAGAASNDLVCVWRTPDRARAGYTLAFEAQISQNTKWDEAGGTRSEPHSPLPEVGPQASIIGPPQKPKMVAAEKDGSLIRVVPSGWYNDSKQDLAEAVLVLKMLIRRL